MKNIIIATVLASFVLAPVANAQRLLETYGERRQRRQVESYVLRQQNPSPLYQPRQNLNGGYVNNTGTPVQLYNQPSNNQWGNSNNNGYGNYGY